MYNGNTYCKQHSNSCAIAIGKTTAINQSPYNMQWLCVS